MYDVTCSEGMQSELSARVPMATRFIFSKNDERGSLGFSMLPRRAVDGSRTCLKEVSEWLRGRDPPRGGNTLNEVL